MAKDEDPGTKPARSSAGVFMFQATTWLVLVVIALALGFLAWNEYQTPSRSMEESTLASEAYRAAALDLQNVEYELEGLQSELSWKESQQRELDRLRDGVLRNHCLVEDKKPAQPKAKYLQPLSSDQALALHRRLNDDYLPDDEVARLVHTAASAIGQLVGLRRGGDTGLVANPSGDPVDVSEPMRTLCTSLEKLGPPLADDVKHLKSRIEVLKGDLAEASSKETEILSVLLQPTDNDSRSRLLIVFGLPTFAIGLILVLIVPPHSYTLENQRLLLSSGLVIQVITVFLLISAIILLGINESLKHDAIASLIGGIAGYVLGRGLENKDEPDPNGNGGSTTGASKT